MAQKTIDEKVDAGHGSFSQGNQKLDAAPGASSSSLGNNGSDSDYINNGLRDAENFANSGANTSSPNSATDLNSRESEAGSRGAWSDNTTPSAKTGAKPKKGLMNTIKGLSGRKKSAVGALITLVVGGGIGFSALFSPGMLIVHMKEIMTDKLDNSSLSLDARGNRLLKAKVEQSTSGFCSNVVSIKCRYSTLSEKNVSNLKAAGIEIQGEQKFGNRTKPTAYTFTDRQGTTTRLRAVEFESFSRSNPEFRTALKQAYNPRFSQFTGKAWSFVSGKLGIDKAKSKIFNGTPEENMNDMNERARGDLETDTRGARKQFTDPDGTCNDACVARNAELDAGANNATASFDESKTNANQMARSAIAAIDLADEGKIAAATAGSAFKITGIVDNACMAYGTVRAVGYAAKTVRAIQLASYAMVFLKAADEIKAGTADAETVAYLGGILTAVSLDVAATQQRISGSATDSLGYKNMAFGDLPGSGSKTATLNQFLAGGGLTGELINFTDQVIATIAPGKSGKEAISSARSTCATLANPWVQGGSLAAGIILMAVPVFGQTVSAIRVAGTIASGAAMAIGASLLPTLMADIVAGTTTDNLMGESSGNAWASGSGVIMSSMNQASGNPPLTVEQAVAYNDYRQEMIALQAEEDRATLSPFDTSSKHTFMGSIVNSFVPLYTSANSAPSKLLATLSLPISTMTQSASAQSTGAVREQYTACADSDYDFIEIAADMFCNPIYAMPKKYLNIDPIQNVDALLAADQITEEGEPKGVFKTFVGNCILREEPIGSAGLDNSGDDGNGCKINDENARWYIYWMDYEAETGMSDEQEAVSESSSMPTGEPTEAPVTGGITENSGNLAADGWAYPLDRGSSIRPDYARHIGNDMPKPVGTKVYAIREGVVSKVEVESAASVARRCWQTTPKGAQNNLEITSVINGVSYIARYAHLNDFNVKQGQRIQAGDLVGHVGFNGCTTGPHLHIDLSTAPNSGVSCNSVQYGRCYIMIRTIFGSSW